MTAKTKDDLHSFLIGKVNSHWSMFESPYLLTEIPFDFKIESGFDYKSILEEQKLKSFVIERTGPDGYKLVQHPTQKSKIGLVPYSANYEFSASATPSILEKPDDKRPRKTTVRYATITFLEAISTLPEEDQDRICIPTKVIARLLSRA